MTQAYAASVETAEKEVVAAVDGAPADADTVTVNGQEISRESATDLVKMLESETARTEFTQNLKTLIETQGQNQEDAAAAEPETFEDMFDNSIPMADLEEQSEVLTDRYEAFLARNNLSHTFMGQIAMSCMSIALFAGMIVLMRHFGKFLKARLEAMQAKFSLHKGRLDSYFWFLGWIVAGTFFCGLLFTNAMIWNITDIANVRTSFAYLIVAKLFHMLLIVVLGVSLFEIASGVIEYALCKSSKTNTNRVKTLLPILRTIAFVFISALFLLVLLSEMGINIMPMVAGAGVIGIAVGFGAQTLVKDYLTGFIILMEDLIRVGDVANVGDRSGLVERLTLRKVQLRDETGTVITVPYSEIRIVHNLTKDFSYYIFEVPITYRQNVDEVIAIMAQTGKEMREDAGFGHLILDDLEIMGVDRFTDSAAIIKARIKTLPIQQWNVGREFNARFKHAFIERGVEISIPKPTAVLVQSPLEVMADDDKVDEKDKDAGPLFKKPANQ